MTAVDPPDTITITEQVGADQQSAGADVFVKVERTGLTKQHPGALEQARARLIGAGLAEEALSTHDVSRGYFGGGWVFFLGVLGAGAAFFLGSRSGVTQWIGVCSFGIGLALYVLGKAKLLVTSTFVLKAHCSDAATVGRLLDVTASSRGLDLDRIQWRYDVAPTARASLIEECIRRANDRAALVARGLGVKLLGVHAYAEVHEDPRGTQGHPLRPMLVPSRARHSRAGSPDAESHGPVAGSERTRSTVTVQYRVGGYQPNP